MNTQVLVGFLTSRPPFISINAPKIKLTDTEIGSRVCDTSSRSVWDGRLTQPRNPTRQTPPPPLVQTLGGGSQNWERHIHTYIHTCTVVHTNLRYMQSLTKAMSPRLPSNKPRNYGTASFIGSRTKVLEMCNSLPAGYCMPVW